MKKALFVILFLAVVIVGFWLIVIPESLILGSIENSLEKYGLSLQTEGFGKGLFFSFSADRMRIVRGNNRISEMPLVVLNDVHGRLQVTSLLGFRPAFHIRAMMNSGQVTGIITRGREITTSISGTGIQTADMESLEQLGVKGEGDLSFTMQFVNGNGEARFSVENVIISNQAIGGTLLPLDLVRSIKGAMHIQSGAITLRSFAFNGDGISARAKGTIRGNDLDLTLEVMTDASLEAGYVYRALLERYRVSPGYYVIPLKTRLFPQAVFMNTFHSGRK